MPYVLYCSYYYRHRHRFALLTDYIAWIKRKTIPALVVLFRAPHEKPISPHVRQRENFLTPRRRRKHEKLRARHTHTIGRRTWKIFVQQNRSRNVIASILELTRLKLLFSNKKVRNSTNYIFV